jgi:transposase
LEHDIFIKHLFQVISDQAALILKLESKISDLENEVHQLRHPKSSNTGSVPPSKEENRKTRSLREKSNKKSGGQPGHEGSTLKFSLDPDLTIKHIPMFCGHCQKDISSIKEELMSTRQVVDLPIVEPIYTQHECYQRMCSCGHASQSSFPSQIKAPIQYGPNVQSTIAYLSVRQFVPLKRMAELFRDVYNMPISQGSIKTLLDSFTKKLSPVYQQIKENIENAIVAGSDETGTKLNGEKLWIHVWQDVLNTFMARSESRGLKAVRDNFPNGLPQTILVSDAWASQLATPAKLHQLCMAHLLRDLNHFIELYPNHEWPVKTKKLFQESIKLRKILEAEGFQSQGSEISKIELEMDKLLEVVIDKEKYKKMVPFVKRLIKNRNYLFNYLYHPMVPSDNNASERSIRNVKIKHKVSGQFKSIEGAHAFVVIRSVIDTIIKRNKNIFECLSLTANLVPE